MKHKVKKIKRSPYRRDVYLAYLIDGARRTPTDGYPIIESWMVPENPPKELVQWDKKKACENLKDTGLSFYSVDSTFNAVLGNPKAYFETISKYACVIGVDPSPFDNMPLVVQKSQIYLNLAITYYYGRQGYKVIPNVRLGDIRTLSALEAYPKKTLISIGTNGFTKALDNRHLFAEEVRRAVDVLDPSGILVYGPAPKWLFAPASVKGIPLYQFDSFMSKRRNKR